MARLALHLGGLLRIRRAHEVRQMRKRIVEADNNETKVIQSHWSSSGRLAIPHEAQPKRLLTDKRISRSVRLHVSLRLRIDRGVHQHAEMHGEATTRVESQLANFLESHHLQVLLHLHGRRPHVERRRSDQTSLRRVY